MDLTLYEKVLGARTTTEAFINDTTSVLNEDFSTASTYREIKIDDIDEECIFVRTKKSSVLDIWLRPNKSINKGMYVLLDDKYYLVREFIPNEIYPKAKIELCNGSLKWEDDLGEMKEYKCIISGKTYEISDATFTKDERLIISSDAELQAILKFNEDTDKIKIQDRFIINKKAFEVLSIDDVTEVYDGVGLLKLTIRNTQLSSSDNVNDGIADDTGDSGWGDW